MTIGLNRLCSRLLLLFFLGAAVITLFPSKASAIAAWSRRYDVPCAACHYPAPPRLNAYGHKFRQAQYRLPEEFNKDPDWKQLKNYLGFRIRGRYEYSSAENPPSGDTHTVSSGFKLNDATLFYAGPVAKNFSGFVELERPGNEEIIEAVVSIGGITGNPDSFWTFRLGQFHTLTRVGWGGLDRPTGITTPDALSRDLTAGGTAFMLNQDQVGAEGTYVHKNWRIIGQVLNGITTGGVTADTSDQNKDKDVLLAYELMWGDIASGLTAYGYRGVQDDPTLIGPAQDRLVFTRFGVTAVQTWKGGLEVQGGFVQAKDNFDLSTLSDIKGEGWWVEVEQYLKAAKDLTVFGRYDSTDPDTDVSMDSRTKITAGLVWPVGDWHARWALELRHITREQGVGNPDLTTQEAAVELMLNF